MKWYGLMDTIPFWGLLIVTVGMLLFFYEGGYRAGRWRSAQQGHEPEVVVRAMVASMTGLMTFILAFMFWIAASHFDAVRQARLNEANTIRTVYLRSDLYPEPNRTKIRNLLREYVDLRLVALKSTNFNDVLSRSESIQNQLWAEAIAAKEKTSSPIFGGYFIQSLNEMIALQTRRVIVGLEFRIPDTAWIVVYIITTLAAAALGYHSGLNETRRTMLAPIFILIFSMAMVMIADLDRPLKGALRVGEDLYIELRRTMNGP